MVTTNKQIESELRQKGYKVTSPRRRIIKAITGVAEHMTPAEIFEVVSRDNPRIGLVTIYRTLDILTELGLICEVHASDNYRSYLMRRPSEHHHHLICSDCGTVIDFTDCDLSELEQRLAQETGFKIKGHLLEFLGECQNCLKGAVT